MEYKYHLEKYHGRSSRHECPKCHDPHSFTYYVDDDGNILDQSVGRCNHESECGYHYTPGEFYKDHPQYSKIGGMSNNYLNHTEKTKVESKKDSAPGFIPKQYVIKSFSRASTLYFYLSNLGVFTEEQLMNAWYLYGIGSTKDHSVIYWQIDMNGKTRTGKIIQYDMETGHRIKSMGANWIHAIMKKRGTLPTSFNLVQCLFGERAISKNPTKKIALVEAEKTAIICSMVLPKYNWVATGGKSQLSVEKLSVLKGKEIIAFPDSDGYDVWIEKAKELRKFGININVSDCLQKLATEEQKKAKVDIADLVLDELILEKRKKEEASVKKESYSNKLNNPNFLKLEESLGLKLVERDYIHEYTHFYENGRDIEYIDYTCPLQVYGKIARNNYLRPLTKEQWIESYQRIVRKEEREKAPKYFEDNKSYFIKEGNKYVFNGKEVRQTKQDDL